jgi:hypothetical protein
MLHQGLDAPETMAPFRKITTFYGHIFKGYLWDKWDIYYGYIYIWIYIYGIIMGCDINVWDVYGIIMV